MRKQENYLQIMQEMPCCTKKSLLSLNNLITKDTKDLLNVGPSVKRLEKKNQLKFHQSRRRLKLKKNANNPLLASSNSLRWGTIKSLRNRFLHFLVTSIIRKIFTVI